MKRILITGASGLVGTHLTNALLQKGYQVVHLGRSQRSGKVPTFVWDANGKIDLNALAGVDAIINLAGAGVADKRWTTSRKRELLESRTRSVALLHNTLANQKHQVKVLVSASAIGYYGFAGSEIFNEEYKPGSDFLAQLTQQWEAEVDKVKSPAIRVVKLRIGIVLSEKGGALPQMAKPIRWGFGAALGSGQQYLSWIHIDDLCALFIKAIDDERLHGAYNAVSGNWVTNKEMTKAIAEKLNRSAWLPNVPSFALKLVLGEMASLVLEGSKVSANKVMQTGFDFKYTQLGEAIKSLKL